MVDLLQSVSRWPGDERVALVCAGTEITFDELARRVSAITRGLGALGLGGRSVCFLLKNGVDLMASYVACLQAGVTAVPLNPRSTPAEIDFFLNACRSRWLLVHEDARTPAVDSPVAMLPVTSPERWRGRARPVRRSGLQPAVIFFTSGTTSRPKGVMHSYASLLASIRPFFTDSFTQRFGATDRFVYLNVASMSDTVGCIHALWTLLARGTVVVMEGFETDSYIEALRRDRPTHGTLFLPQAIRLLSHPAISPALFRSFRMLCFGGDKTPVELIETTVEKTGLVPLVGYGLTESFVVALNDSVSPSRFGSMGRPVDGVGIRIVDEHLRPVRRGAIGEIIVRSPQNMLGYLRDRAATKRVLLDGNWLRTGDLASIDADGYLWFAARRKQIIIRGGENISPQEIEAALHRVPAVKQAVVVGARHPVEGEVPEAFVELRSGMAASAAELQAHLKRNLVHYKVPAAIYFLTEWPLTRTGKVDRRALSASRAR